MKKTFLLWCFLFCNLLVFPQCPDNNHPHAVDLGLPSGKCWSCCNVNADSPEEFGGYYAYGEYNEKSSYSQYNYLYYTDLGYGYTIWDGIGELTDISGMISYDAAFRLMGNDWQMPTRQECEELVENCTWEWVGIDGWNGYIVIGPNGNYIFLPSTGYKSGSNHNSVGERGLYRSSNWTMIGGEAMTSYAIDFNNSEVEVDITGYRANGMTIRPINTAKIGCYVNESYLEYYKNEEARGFTADGKSEIAITYTCPLTSIDENIDIKFYVEDQEVDEMIAGTIKEVRNMRDSLAVILTAPNDFQFIDKSEYEVKVEITPYHYGEPLTKKSYTYRVLRPCVIFIHGLNGKGNLFVEMGKYLVNRKLYTDKQLYYADYEKSNTSDFEFNTHYNTVVMDGCNELCKRLFESDSIVCSKFDMIGHSMGGILARLYAQEVENGYKSTNRIITINTPHYGSIIGNAVAEHIPTMIQDMKEMANPIYGKTAQFFQNIYNMLIEGFKDEYFGSNPPKAIRDLAIGSEAIMNLNGPKSERLIGIPVHSICTYIENMDNYYSLIPPPFSLYHLLMKLVVVGIHEDLSDIVVSLESQKGGLEGGHTSVFPGGVLAFHCLTPYWNNIKAETANLLISSGDEINYSLHGFPSHTSNKLQFMDDYDFISHFNIPNDTSYISASIVPVLGQEYSHVCDINYSNDMLTYGIFAKSTDSTLIFSMENNHIELDLSDVKSEELMFYLVGRTNYDALVIDSVVVNMGEDPTSVCPYNEFNNQIDIIRNSDHVIIKLSSYQGNVQWQLYSMDGLLIDNGNVIETEIKLYSRKRGVYILKLTKDNKMYTYKILL